jgi:hypothetical protein
MMFNAVNLCGRQLYNYRMQQTEVKEKLKQISAERRQWDELSSELQGLLKGRASKLPVARLRQ